MGIFFIEQDGA
jgi:SCY1-like protein 1